MDRNVFLKVGGRTCDDAASHSLAKLDVLDRSKVPMIRHPLEAAFHFSLGRTRRISLYFHRESEGSDLHRVSAVGDHTSGW